MHGFDEYSSTRSEDLVELGEHPAVPLVAEVPEARKPVYYAIESLDPLKIAYITLYVLDVKALPIRIAARMSEEPRRHIDSSDLCPPRSQTISDTAMSAWGIEHVDIRPEIEQPADQVHFSIRPLGEHVFVKVQIIVVEDISSVE